MAAEAKVNGKTKKSSPFTFLKEVKSEFKKITWASKKDVLKSTGVVLFIIVLFTLVVWLMDAVFGTILNTILNYFG
ncbi:MAG: preprotein translocase subunit SecE [Clostridium sp.]|uniref:preprotein translocase subunit SecE n=1 Tax=Clostridium sp. TaxID=1506 RepID=UPI002FCC3578